MKFVYLEAFEVTQSDVFALR